MIKCILDESVAYVMARCTDCQCSSYHILEVLHNFENENNRERIIGVNLLFVDLQLLCFVCG